jgi:hypothetical protein
MTRILAVSALATLAAAQLAAQAAPSVTLFTNGQVLVRRTLPIRVPTGTSTHAVAIGPFAAASLASLDPAVRLDAVRFDPAWSEEAILRRHVGRVFTFRREVDKPPVTARLVAMDPERWAVENAGGPGVVFGRPGQIVWPADLVPQEPAADVTVTSSRAQDGVRVLYQTSGASWQAQYRLFAGTSSRFEGSASIGTGALDLADAEVQLLAGDIGAPAASPAAQYGRVVAMEMSAAKADFGGAATEEAVGEARLYTLPGRVSFTPGTQLVRALFEPATVQAEKRYAVGGALPYWGGFGEDPEEREVPVEVTWRFDRKPGTTFGDLPLPGGGVSIFEADKGGRVQLVGQGSIGHTAPGEELSVRTGTAFDVTARRTQTAFSTSRTVGTATTPSRTIATMAFRVVLKNAKDSAVTVEVREDRAGEWSVLDSSVPAERRSASRAVFPVRIAAKGETTLTYRLRVVW